MRLTALGIECEVIVHAGDRSEALARELSAPWAWCISNPNEPVGLRLDMLLSTDPEECSAGFAKGWLVAGAVDELADRLTGLITREAIGLRRESHIMLHAGAVADPLTGVAAAFIGPSGRGKTTATTALARHFAYLSDETVAVGEGRSILAYPKPLSVKVPGESWKRQAGPQELGLLEPSQTNPVLRTLLLLDRQADHQGVAVLEPVSLGEVLDELVPQISYLPARDKPLRRLAQLVAECGGLQRVRYAEAESLVPLVRELLDNPLPTLADATFARPATDAAPAVAADETADLYRRGPVDDAIFDEAGLLLVLAHNAVTALAGIAPTIWSALAVPRSLEEITAEVVAAHGRPEGVEPRDLVRAAIADLVKARLVIGPDLGVAATSCDDSE